MPTPEISSRNYAPNDSNRDASNRLMFVGGNARTLIKNTAVSVSATAVALPSTPLANRLFITLQNQGNEAIFLGNSDVTTATGLALLPFAVITCPYEDAIALYGICVTGPATCIVHEGK